MGTGNPFNDGEILVPAVCPRCGALFVTSDRGTHRCAFCGAEYLPGDSFLCVEGNLTGYYDIAVTAFKAGNFSEAYEYFNKIISISPSETAAWFGKGFAAGYLSTASSIRSKESILYFEKVIEYWEPKNRDVARIMVGRAAGVLGELLIDRLNSNGAADVESLNRAFELMVYWARYEAESELYSCWIKIVELADKYPSCEAIATDFSNRIRKKFNSKFLNKNERAGAEINYKMKKAIMGAERERLYLAKRLREEKEASVERMRMRRAAQDKLKRGNLPLWAVLGIIFLVTVVFVLACVLLAHWS